MEQTKLLTMTILLCLLAILLETYYYSILHRNREISPSKTRKYKREILKSYEGKPAYKDCLWLVVTSTDSGFFKPRACKYIHAETIYMKDLTDEKIESVFQKAIDDINKSIINYGKAKN